MDKDQFFKVKIYRMEYLGERYITNISDKTTFANSDNQWYLGYKLIHPEWWLEEVTLPSEEDKQVIVKEAWETKDVDPSSFMAGFNKAIELIKGGKK